VGPEGRNAGSTPRKLRSFSYVEFSFADAINDLTNLDWAQHIVFSSCDSGVIRVGTKFNPLTYFFASSEAPSGYTCDRETSLAAGETWRTRSLWRRAFPPTRRRRAATAWVR